MVFLSSVVRLNRAHSGSSVRAKVTFQRNPSYAARASGYANLVIITMHCGNNTPKSFSPYVGERRGFFTFEEDRIDRKLSLRVIAERTVSCYSEDPKGSVA
jgi:hypothetical protein